MTGVVKFYDAVKGYGFIEPESGGKDVFFHQSSLQEVRHVSTGHEVEYSLFPVFKKPRAVTVRVLSNRTYAPVREMKKGAAYGTD